MKINLKVRAKNPAFWAGLAAAVMLPVLTAVGMSWEEVTSWQRLGTVLLKALDSPVITVSVITSVYNALIDPTTKGVSDSERALSYSLPGGGSK